MVLSLTHQFFRQSLLLQKIFSTLCSLLSIVFNLFHATYFFYTPWKHQKTFDFLLFSGGMKKRPAWNGIMEINNAIIIAEVNQKVWETSLYFLRCLGSFHGPFFGLYENNISVKRDVIEIKIIRKKSAWNLFQVNLKICASVTVTFACDTAEFKDGVIYLCSSWAI